MHKKNRKFFRKSKELCRHTTPVGKATKPIERKESKE